MPKEVIKDDAQLYDVHVGWSRDAEVVQVGIEVAEGDTLLKRLWPKVDELLDRHGVNREDVELLEWRGVWSNLDRRKVNELIRSLRRARDQAFGRDE